MKKLRAGVIATVLGAFALIPFTVQAKQFSDYVGFLPAGPDIEGTLSYFVSGNSKYAEDSGFALRPWSKVRFDNHTVKMHGNIAIAMGHYYFTGPDRTETKVEYTKGYVKTPDNRVLIFLQDSSMPHGS